MKFLMKFERFPDFDTKFKIGDYVKVISDNTARIVDYSKRFYIVSDIDVDGFNKNIVGDELAYKLTNIQNGLWDWFSENDIVAISKKDITTNKYNLK